MVHRQPLGTFCGLTSDTEEDVYEGDIVRTSAGTCYRIVETKKTSSSSRYYPYRNKLRCVRIASDDIEDDDFIHPLYWYSRDKK